MVRDPSNPTANSPGFTSFAKCFCINPVYVNPVYGGGHYQKRKGWVLIDLGTRAETNFKTLRDARQHLVRLYTETAPATLPAGGG